MLIDREAGDLSAHSLPHTPRGTRAHPALIKETGPSYDAEPPPVKGRSAEADPDLP